MSDVADTNSTPRLTPTPPVVVRDPDDPKRFKATCLECGYITRRAKRAAAEHAITQHYTYTHL